MTTARSIVRYDDLIITVAYFSIPLQIVVALVRYPRLRSMPWHLLLLTILFALFIFLCDTGHFFHCMGMSSGVIFDALNITTAAVSLTTAIYLLPLVPHLFDALDKTLMSEIQAKRKVLTFMSFLCHEIRNPLFAITSTISFMGDDKSLSEEQRESLGSIEQSAHLMLRLVNDVLDISKLESGKLRLEQVKFDILKMLRGVAASVRTDIWQKHGDAVSFEYTIDSSVPRLIIGDSVRLLQIVFNLLSNSAKFTDGGCVKFSVKLVPVTTALMNDWITEDALKASTNTNNKRGGSKDADATGETDPLSESSIRTTFNSKDFPITFLDVEEGQCREPSSFQQVVLQLEVEDSGVGISPERQRHIFEPYSQAKLSDYRKHGGTGLGLSIVSRLVTTMGGSIHVESQLHKGSRFRVYLPVKVDLRAHTTEAEVDACDPEDDDDEAGLLIPADLALSETDVLLDSSTRSSQSSLGGSMRTNHVLSESQWLKPILVADSSTSVGSLDLDTDPSPETPPETPQGSPKSDSFSKGLFNFDYNEKVVLVTDDNAINRKLLGRMLKHFHLQYITAENGQEAVDLMKQSRNFTHNPEAPYIGLVLMDWSMPVMDGYTAIRTIRGSLELDVPIVALTACALEEGLQELMKAGSNEISTKPILRDELLRLCRRYLVERQSEDVRIEPTL